MADLHPPFGSATSLRRLRRAVTVRMEGVVLVLGLCLPIPLFAATGLSIPLPSAVERIAAALVPWAEPAMSSEASERAAVGAIVPTPRESADGDPSSVAAPEPPKQGGPATGNRLNSARPVLTSTVAPAPSVAAPRAAVDPRPAGTAPAPAPAPAIEVDTPRVAAAPATPQSDTPKLKPVSSIKPKPEQGAEPKLDTVLEPVPEPLHVVAAPVQDVVETVQATVEPVVDEVTKDKKVKEKAKEALDAVTGLVG